jgi:hypothetical protein
LNLCQCNGLGRKKLFFSFEAGKGVCNPSYFQS